MKLYLSSYNIPNPSDLFELIGLSVNDIKLAVIVNGKDHYDEVKKHEKIEKLTNYLHEVGFKEPYLMDLNTYTNGDEVKNILKDFDLLWVAGGNTFFLRYAMKKSGFDSAISELVRNGLVYAGDSAGAVVAGPSLKGVELVDDVTKVAEVINIGLGLVPFVTIPHIDSPYIAEEMRKVAALYSDDEKIELGDTQAVTYIDGRITKFSAVQ